MIDSPVDNRVQLTRNAVNPLCNPVTGACG